ncbi:lung seven transmembrane receptor [Anaeramoeba flamelloides]|uniref:Lung seven transmembrane receptor n=1 Tax=Anaeramoeba flamelloides TaxID=1746091 RepID=A0AAV7ZID0_9EUKA|nr:lung seven transmembrane receptor [Anaeramoeba flamelloides]
MKFLYFLLFLTTLSLSQSIIRETELKVSNTVINFEEFGFLSGGSYKIEIANLTKSETSSRMIIVDDGDYHLIENQNLSCDKVDDNSDYYFDVQQINGERLYTNSTFKKEEELIFCLTNCDYKSIEFQIKYTFLNPNGEHLSSGLILVPKIFFFSIFFYCFLLLLWLINWFKFRGSKILLHRCVSMLIVLKEIESIVLYFYWSYNSHVGKYNFAIIFFVSIYEVFCDTLLYFVLLLIAHGLSIVRTNLNLDTYCMLMFLSISVVIFIQIELILSKTTLKLIFLFVCAFSFFLMIKQVLIASEFTLRHLSHQRQLFRNQNMNFGFLSVNAKIKMLKRFKILILIYIFTFLNCLIYKHVISLKYIWTYYFFVFVTDLILYYGIGYTFCFRELGMFQDQDDHQHHNSSSASDALPPLLEHEIDDTFEGVPVIIANPTKRGDDAEWSVAFETEIQKQPDNVNFEKKDFQQNNLDVNINKNDNITSHHAEGEDVREYRKYKSKKVNVKNNPKRNRISQDLNSELEMSEYIPLTILGNDSIDDLETTNKREKMGELSDPLLNNEIEDQTDSQFTITERHLQEGLTNELITENERKEHSNISSVVDFSDEMKLLNEKY